ncbi:unnamed protein product, partial [Rotaria socialis]
VESANAEAKLTLDDFTEIDNQFWEETKNLDENALSTLKNKAVGRLENGELPIEKIDLSGNSYRFIVHHLLQVQQTKIDKRGRATLDGKTYTTASMWKKKRSRENLLKCDPLTETIICDGKEFLLGCTYNGSANSTQPGNCLLCQMVSEKLRSLTFYRVPQGNFENTEAVLILLMEIVRRRIIDNNHQYPPPLLIDEYHDLPVGLGIAMVVKLIKDKYMLFEEFWKKEKSYHIFTDNKNNKKSRYTAFDKIAKLYMEKYPSLKFKEDLKNLMQEFYDGRLGNQQATAASENRQPTATSLQHGMPDRKKNSSKESTKVSPKQTTSAVSKNTSDSTDDSEEHG